MIHLEIDEEHLKDLYLEKVKEKLEELESEVFFMNSKQLSAYLNMSWNTIVENLLYEDNFPSIRLGSKWLFNRKEVEAYMEKYYNAVRNNGGDILRYKRKA
ncbi:helix-turn-helix domain-containing protein [Virgibacillus salexigens]|uniref:DNA binding domain, excisionase family n=1 Tax=Virgibacillus massiliensis TaxID=1462526 RepID=A0A024QHX2_9BACI|nr:helix-turn-helix domain-containing protein [Virgibacillus massiliensis]CDQ41531.1 DNA binding domain, excisionase family [Virgibacillus massiliensis]